MNENIDLTKILKNCPEGWKFYSYIFGEETYFQEVSTCQGSSLPISIYGKYGGYKFRLSSKGHPYCDKYGECCIFPSKDQRDWSKFTAPWFKKERFDPKTLKAFDKVIVRYDDFKWKLDFFSHYEVALNHHYKCISDYYKYCIPYNDDTKHLVGTREEAPEYYKYWED